MLRCICCGVLSSCIRQVFLQPPVFLSSLFFEKNQLVDCLTDFYTQKYIIPTCLDALHLNLCIIRCQFVCLLVVGMCVFVGVVFVCFVLVFFLFWGVGGGAGRAFLHLSLLQILFFFFNL